MNGYDWKWDKNPIRRTAKRLLSGEPLKGGRPLSELIELDDAQEKSLPLKLHSQMNRSPCCEIWDTLPMRRSPRKGMPMENEITAFISEKNTAQPAFVKKIGNTTFDIYLHFSETSKETFTDKVLRLIQNDHQAE